uniref:Tankyrase 1-binding protein C-terminal domain-containing protein n=1 Tax=Neolamprologus brichardi TaxID=32507 RepID=A0A3Q4M319_NEOBR
MEYLGGKLSVAQSQVSGWVGNVRRSLHGALSFLSTSAERGGRGEDDTGDFKRTNSLRSLASRSRESFRRFSLRSQQRLSLRRRTAPNTPTAVRRHTYTHTLSTETYVLRSRAQLGKKRAPRTRPTRATRQSAAQAEGEGGTTEDWLYRDSTEAKAESKDDDSDSEEKPRGADAAPAVASQPQRVALFPGMDPSALKAQLKKRGDSDNQTDGPASSPSQLSRSPKSPFLPRAARVLPPSGGKENGQEDSPQWLKELKSKKRLSQYESES